MPSQAESSSGSGGILRGFLSSVAPVSGANYNFEQKVQQLSNEIGVLQEELESKINENERLVMESSDIKREKSNVEFKLEKAEVDLERALNERRCALDDTERMKRDKAEFTMKIGDFEVQVDSLRREVVLLNETIRRLQTNGDHLQSQLLNEQTLNCKLDESLKEAKKSLVQLESRLSQSLKDLTNSESDRSRLQAELMNEKVKEESVRLRISQLEEELSIAAMHRSGGPEFSYKKSDNAVVPACYDEPVACCYRSEFFQSKLKTAEEALRLHILAKHKS